VRSLVAMMVATVALMKIAEPPKSRACLEAIVFCQHPLTVEAICLTPSYPTLDRSPTASRLRHHQERVCPCLGSFLSVAGSYRRATVAAAVAAVMVAVDPASSSGASLADDARLLSSLSFAPWRTHAC